MLCLLILLFQAICHLGVDAQIKVPELSISKDESFNIRVSIEDIREGHIVRYRYQLDEAYSREQRRTVIKYKILGPTRDEWFKEANLPEEGSIFVEEGSQAPLLLVPDDNGRLWCQELDWAKFKKLCKIDFLEDQLAKRGSDESNRGPSGILFLLEAVRETLAQVRTKSDLSFDVHNMPGVMFTVPTSNTSTQISLLYAKSQIDKGGRTLPLQISVDEMGGRHLEYDFWLDPREDVAEVDSSVSAAYANDLTFDRFFIGRATGCSSLASSEHTDTTIAKLVEKQESFSFQAKAAAFVMGRDMLSHVAYHKELKLMRIDRETGLSKTNMLIDFRAGKTYRALMKLQHSRDALPGSLRSLMLSNTDADRCITVKSPQSSFNLERMLLGSKGVWRYLGVARVRGLRARAYEAYDTDFPMWVQQPVSYTRGWPSKGDLEYVHDARGDSSKRVKLTTVVYLSDKSHGQAELIHMEIFRINMDSHKILQAKSISFFDFSWQVNRLSVWPRMSSIFSMAAQCDLEQQVGQHLQVSMSITRETSTDDDTPESLTTSARRDLALIVGLQSELGIPSTMIHDLESRLISRKSSDQQSTLLTSISLVFGLAKGTQRMVGLHFYGTGKPIEGAAGLTSMVGSLRDCYYLVAHQKVNTFFGYSEKTSLCVADLDSDSSVLVRNSLVVKPKKFEVYTHGPLDIYLVNHGAPEDEPSFISRLRDLSTRGSETSRQIMKRVIITDPANRMTHLLFVIKHLKITGGDTVGWTQRQLRQAGSATGACNFGLIPDANLALVHTLDNDDDPAHRQAVDFQTCQAACFIDPNCKAFSICLRGAQAECVLTSVDFADLNLELQLADILEGQPSDKSKLEYRLKVDLDTEIKVRRSTSCELYKKSYLDAFRKRGKPRLIDLKRVKVRTVSGGPDECARHCFEETRNVLLRLGDVNDAVENHLDSLANNYEQLELNSLDDITEVQKKWSANVCQSFYYLDTANLFVLPTHMSDELKSVMDKSSDSPTGFCFVVESPEQSTGATSETSSHQELAPTDEYLFRFETIYQKKFGLKLLTNRKAEPEYAAYKQVVELGRLPSNRNDLELLKDIVARRENSQITMMTDESSCALACTLQTIGPWPSCRSFDLIVVSRGFNSTTTICRLNSISFRDAVEAGRTNLIDSHHDNNQMKWHYEPRFHLPSDYPTHLLKQVQFEHHYLTTSTVITLGLLAGLAIGAALVVVGFKRNNRDRPLTSFMDEL